MGSDDIWIVVRLYTKDDKTKELQYLTPKGIWDKLIAKAKKFPKESLAIAELKPNQEMEIWRMAPVDGEPDTYRVVSEYTNVGVPEPKKTKKESQVKR